VRVPTALAIVVVAAACSQPSIQRGASSSPSASVDAGCGGTRVAKGGQPSWSSSAGSLEGLRFVLSNQDDVAGFLFGPSLRAGHPTNPTNKILWVVREPRNGQPLHIAAAPDASTEAMVAYDFPANSSPGEIYPSIVDVPAPGCWRLTLTWGGNRAELSLLYAAPSEG
jgi:hypothetical protein